MHFHKNIDCLTILCVYNFYRNFKLVKMAGGREGEATITIPLQYNDAVSK